MSLTALSPLDGRYHTATQSLSSFFSEAAIINKRCEIEIRYFIFLSEQKIIRSLTPAEKKLCRHLIPLKPDQIQRIKTIEQTTHHDIKAIEYFLKEQFETTSLKDLIPYLHYCLTSEDINNLAWRLQIIDSQSQVLLPQLKKILIELAALIEKYQKQPMLARTHGQGAVPTTFGKEMAVFAMRLLHQIQQLESCQLTGKLSGAIGSFNSFYFVQPDLNWLTLSGKFVKSLGLTPNNFTTQINPADDLIELFQQYHLLNSILIDFNQDMWRYISDGWLVQHHAKGQVGSSTMPQKINPIQFENSEGNLGVANSLFEGFSRKLPISRLQRDLSDSTVLRNIGVAFGHSLLAYQNLISGIQQITVNTTQMTADLNANWNILAEALNVSGRTSGNTHAYETAMSLLKGKEFSQADWQKTTQKLGTYLSELTPQKYLGLSVQIAQKAHRQLSKYLQRKAS